MRATRVTVVVPCVCMCVYLFVVLCHHAHLYRPRNIGSSRHGKTFIIVIFAKNAWFRSYGVICLPRMPPITLATTNDGYQRNQLKVGRPLIVTTLTKNASFRSYGTFALSSFVRIYIRNINMRRYIISACGHEFGWRVRAHAYHTLR